MSAATGPTAADVLARAAAWPTAADLAVVRAQLAYASEHVARLRGLALCDAVERLTAQRDAAARVIAAHEAEATARPVLAVAREAYLTRDLDADRRLGGHATAAWDAAQVTYQRAAAELAAARAAYQSAMEAT